MQYINNYTLEVKKSKFIAYLYEIEDVIDAKEVINIIKKEHKKASHIVYAYRVSNTAGKSDDKEPSNSAGMPIYRLLEQKNLNKHIIVVARYFGGTKLGVGLLTRTYKNAALGVLKNG